MDPPGTCYTTPDLTSSTLELATTSCAKLHDYELVSHELATGDDKTYPTASYWDGAVAQKCYQDLLSYTATTRDRWPATLRSDQFVPRPDGWKTGDRDVYCLADSRPRTAGTVKGLVSSSPPPASSVSSTVTA